MLYKYPLIAVSLLLGSITLPVHGVAAPSQIELPDIGSTASAALTPEQEQRIGEKMMAELRQSGQVLDDPQTTAYINKLGLRLLSTERLAADHFSFFVVNDPSINAFAMPGGFIGVHTGLILATRSESELAAVLAHEIAHVSQHHLARSYEKAQQLNLPMTAAIIAAILLGQQNPQAGQAAIAGTLAGSTQAQLNFTRSNEQEADRVGIQMLALSDFDPRSMPSFFERLQQQTRYYDNGVPEFLQTHPVTAARIADARNRASHYPRHDDHDSLDYRLAKAALRVDATTDPIELSNQLRRELSDNHAKDALADHYSLALAEQRSGDPETALRTLSALLKENPDSIRLILSAADMARDAKHPEKALALVRGALIRYPGNEYLVQSEAESLLQLGQPEQARHRLHDLSTRFHVTPETFQLLAKAENRLGHTGASQLAQAEYYYRRGQLHAAIEQLEMAQKDPNIDFYHGARIDARLAQLRREAKRRDDD